MLDDRDRATLLAIARRAIIDYVNGAPPVPAQRADDVDRPAGAFVTIHNHGELRGCIGHIEADRPVSQVVADCARAACSSDPRFPAVTAGELPHLAIELSVLGPLEPVNDPAEITVGRHGLVVAMGWHRGLLLPQVATEWHWDRMTFLEQTCHKAGLPRDAWKTGAKVWRFEAEVFAERHRETSERSV